MRELKFRAWDNVTLKMSAPFALFGEFTLLGAVHDWQHEMGHTAKTSLEALGSLEVMQSTGLFDKNGKEIFEGDIFRVEEQADDRMYYLVIHWIKEWCMFGCLTVGEYTDYLATGISALDEPMFWTYALEDTDSQKFFLCGNIYQNANLLQI